MNKPSYIDNTIPFGLMMPDNGARDHSPDEGSDPPPVHRPARKRGSKDSRSDEDAKKQGNGKRGRPRVESQDQSAIEACIESLKAIGLAD